jgi:hypothetical protein
VAAGGLHFDRFLATGVIALAMVVFTLLSPKLRKPARE